MEIASAFEGLKDISILLLSKIVYSLLVPFESIFIIRLKRVLVGRNLFSK